jgi:hypothetical protein
MKWKCKDGRTISLPEMTDQHLSNSMRMLERKGLQGGLSWRHLEEELKRRIKAGAIINGKSKEDTLIFDDD